MEIGHREEDHMAAEEEIILVVEVIEVEEVGEDIEGVEGEGRHDEFRENINLAGNHSKSLRVKVNEALITRADDVSATTTSCGI